MTLQEHLKRCDFKKIAPIIKLKYYDSKLKQAKQAYEDAECALKEKVKFFNQLKFQQKNFFDNDTLQKNPPLPSEDQSLFEDYSVLNTSNTEQEAILTHLRKTYQMAKNYLNKISKERQRYKNL